MALFSRRVFLTAPALAQLGPTPVIIVQANIGFQAHAVGIDNYSAFYLYVRDADAYVPPFWGGVVLVLNHTTDYAYAELASPFGDPQTPIDDSFFVNFTWTDANAPFNGGSSIAGTSSVIPPFNVVDDFTVQFLTTVIDLNGVAQALPATSMPGRTSLMLQAPVTNTEIIYIGGPIVTPDLTSTGGVQLYPGQSIPIEAGATAVIYGIQDGGLATQQVIVIEGR